MSTTKTEPNRREAEVGELLRPNEVGITVVSALGGDAASEALRAAADILNARFEVIAGDILSDPNWKFDRKEGLHLTVCSMIDPLKEQGLPRSMQRKKKFFGLNVETALSATKLADMQPFEVKFNRAVLAAAGVVVLVGSCSNPGVIREFRELLGLLTGSWRYFDSFGRANADVWVNVGRFAKNEPDAEFPRANVEGAVAELNPLSIELEIERLAVVEYRDRGLASGAIRRCASLDLPV